MNWFDKIDSFFDKLTNWLIAAIIFILLSYAAIRYDVTVSKQGVKEYFEERK